MRRLKDWPGRLASFITATEDDSFVWGENDCCLRAANAVKVITGVDVATKFRGKYKTARGAAGVLKRFTNGGVGELAFKIAQDYGLEEIHPSFAQRGDVVLVELPETGPSLGFIDLNGLIRAVHESGGDVQLPVSKAVTAWRIG